MLACSRSAPLGFARPTAHKRRKALACSYRSATFDSEIGASVVDRKTTQALNEKSTTATELAKLYAHVQAMPESAQKKKLVN